MQSLVEEHRDEGPGRHDGASRVWLAEQEARLTELKEDSSGLSFSSIHMVLPGGRPAWGQTCLGKTVGRPAWGGPAWGRRWADLPGGRPAWGRPAWGQTVDLPGEDGGQTCLGATWGAGSVRVHKSFHYQLGVLFCLFVFRGIAFNVSMKLQSTMRM